MKRAFMVLAFGAALCARPGSANDYPEVGLHPGYKLMGLRPAGFEPQVTGMDFMPNGDMIVLTWRGTSGPSAKDQATGMDKTGTRTGTTRLYRVTNTRGETASAIKVTEIASGFKDAQGLCIVDSTIYVGDLDRIVKMVDKDGDGKYEEKAEIGKIPAYDGWFEYSFGPVHKDGKLYMALAGNVMMSGWPAPQFGKDRSTVISIPIGGGAYSVVAEGLRAPDGIAIGPDGEIFTTDNQGGWRPASQFLHIKQGRFYGYFTTPVGPIQTAVNSKVTPPAIWAPYREANDSPTEPALMLVGPYKGQFIYGDVGRGGIYRAFLEKVGGEYQGSIVSFSGGLECGVHRVRTGPNGEIYMGGIGNGSDSNQGWNGKMFGLQKLTPNGTEVFEILATRSRAKGMELEFTQAVGAAASTAANYTVQQWRNVPAEGYGVGKGVNEARTVKSVQISTDRKSVFLEIDGLKAGYVVGIQIKNVASQDNKALWYAKTWYTLNNISTSAAFEATVPVGLPAAAATPSLLQVERLADKLKILLPDDAAYKVELLDFQGRSRSGDVSATGSAMIDTRGLRSGLHILRAVRAGKTLSRSIVL